MITIGEYYSQHQRPQIANSLSASAGGVVVLLEKGLWEETQGGGQPIVIMNSFYPKDASGKDDMPGPDVYRMVGGDVYAMYQTNPAKYRNACALRISVALNKSGVDIPDISGTFQGADGKYYFLGASTLKGWMTSYFGAPDISVTKDFESAISGSKGIYIMEPNYPSRFGASGHATLYNVSDCIGGHCYFNAGGGGTYRVSLWILQ